jgi:hypothetical protein
VKPSAFLSAKIAMRVCMVLVLMLGAACPGHAESIFPSWIADFAASRTEPARSVEDLALQIRSMAETVAALAAGATAEGHWRLINRAGETITTASAEEMRRVLASLVPDDSQRAKLRVLLTEETVFDHRDMLKELPPTADLSAMIGATTYPLVRSARGETSRLYAEVRASLVVDLATRNLFDEALAQLSRSVDKRRTRVIALEPTATAASAVAMPSDAAAGRMAVDRLDPARIAAAFSAIQGQTAVLTGRVTGDTLTFKPSSGSEASLSLAAVAKAAADADVDLVVLRSSSARQPGARNWLWLKSQVRGLDTALGRLTLADFIQSLGDSGRRFMMSVAHAGTGRAQVAIHPATDLANAPSTYPFSNTIGELVSEVAGRTPVTGIDGFLRSADRDRELQRRLVHGVPSVVQAVYLAAFALGLVGLGAARRWWRRLWPPETASDYGNSWGYRAAAVLRSLVFVALFLPLCGPFAALAALLGLGKSQPAALSSQPANQPADNAELQSP